VQWSTEAHPSSTPSRAQLQPGPAPSVEDGTALFWRERARLAEGVDPARVRGTAVEHLATDQGDVVVHPLAVLVWDDVGTEERRLVAQFPGDLQLALLVVARQAVAGLDLDRRRSRATSLGDELCRPRSQLVVGCLACRRDRGGDAARRVRLARHPGGELR
jgi:hypothetical protein